MNAETIPFIGEVSPGETLRVEHEFRGETTISGIDASTYLGQEFTLEYRYYVRTREGQRVNLLAQQGGSDYLAGNDNDYSVSVRHEVERGDTLVVELRNTSDQTATSRTWHYSTLVHTDDLDISGEISEWLDATTSGRTGQKLTNLIR